MLVAYVECRAASKYLLVKLDSLASSHENGHADFPEELQVDTIKHMLYELQQKKHKKYYRYVRKQIN